MDHNYVNDTSTFLDAASSSLMASSVFRLATLSSIYHFLPHAEAFRTSLISGNSANNNSASITSDGWLQPVVNPQSFSSLGSDSPESESFVLLMEAAYRDWMNAGSHGANAGRRRVSCVGGGLAGALLMMGATVATIVL
jgi:hypothetical protein